jgi:hypothetical protein
VPECDRVAWIKKRLCPICGCCAMEGGYNKSQAVNDVWGNNFHLLKKSYRTHCVDKTRRFHFKAGGIHSYQCTLKDWLRHCVTKRNVAGSIPDGVIGIFH